MADELTSTEQTARLAGIIANAVEIGTACVAKIPREDCERVARLVHREIERTGYAIVCLKLTPPQALRPLEPETNRDVLARLIRESGKPDPFNNPRERFA